MIERFNPNIKTQQGNSPVTEYNVARHTRQCKYVQGDWL